jgi:hypothetical protein
MSSFDEMPLAQRCLCGCFLLQNEKVMVFDRFPWAIHASCYDLIALYTTDIPTKTEELDAKQAPQDDKTKQHNANAEQKSK